jgi:hypothetical protein
VTVGVVGAIIGVRSSLMLSAAAVALIAVGLYAREVRSGA